jgi:hypothetical protein
VSGQLETETPSQEDSPALDNVMPAGVDNPWFLRCAQKPNWSGKEYLHEASNLVLVRQRKNQGR